MKPSYCKLSANSNLFVCLYQRIQTFQEEFYPPKSQAESACPMAL